MSFFTGKKLLLIGMFLLLLIGIPVTIYILQQQTNNQSHAQKSTVLSYTPDSTQASPIQKVVGDEFTLDLMVNPGVNLVSFVSFEIHYDPQYLSVASSNGFVPNAAAFPTILEGPTVTPGKITGTLSVGAEPTRAIQTLTKAGTITFKALKTTSGQTTKVDYILPTTKVLSIGSKDQFSEDVLSSQTPAYVLITAEGGVSITPGLTPTDDTPTDEPTPPDSGEPTPPDTENPDTSSSNIVPVCSNLTVSPQATGNAPFTASFTTEGSDSDGTIDKITYNFGDGQVSDITDAGGAGTATVSAETTHTYNNPGTYQVSSILTDDAGGVSTQNGCTQTITVLGNPTPTLGTSATPTLEPTGPGDTFIGIGAVVAVLTIIGSFLFFAL